MNDVISRSAALLVLALCLAGCWKTAAQQSQRNDDICAARGLKPNTDAFTDCVVRLETERDVRIQQRHRDLLERNAIPPGR